MTLPQALSLAILAGMLVLFVSDRLRFDVVALLTLLTAVACGIIPADQAFDGFKNSLLPLIASALILSTAVRNSGVIETGLRPLRPLLHHAAAVIVMGPVAASLAHQLHVNVDSFLMAVAVGAGSDFLSSIGHQCNTLVMGPGGYRFSDYWRLGLPLSTLVVLCGVPLILFAWPLH